jgi:hypothetical protein
MANNFYTFQTDVASAGTPVALDNQSVEPHQSVTVRAKADNTGDIYIGNSSSDAADSDERFTLAAGESLTFQVPNTGLIWIDSEEDGDGVEVVVGASGGSAGGGGGSSSGGDTQTAGADDESNTANSQRTSARLMGFNSSTWERLRTVAGAGDGGAPRILATGQYGYNGSTWDRFRASVSGIVSAITGFLNNIPFLQYLSSAPTLTDEDWHHFRGDVNANLMVALGSLLAGEDLTNNVMKVEHQYSYSRKTADGQVKASAGFVHTVTFSATGTVTAGVITLYDATSETGTVLWSGTIQTGLNPRDHHP